MSRTHLRRSFIVASILLAPLASLSGCGGSSGDATTPVEEDTKKLEERQNQIKDQYSKQPPSGRK